MSRSTGAVAALVGLLLAVPPMAAASELSSDANGGQIANPDSVESAAIAFAVAERAAFGLPADLATVTSLLGSSLDAGTRTWGIPMTAQEEAAVDLPSRMTFAGYANEEAIPFARALPEFAGVYFDQTRGGKLVVLLVGNGHDAEQRAIARLLPPAGPGLEVRSARYTFAQLHEAWSFAAASWPSEIELLTTGIDERANAISLGVSGADLAAAVELDGVMERSLGVDVEIRSSERPTELACTTRENCANPTRAGVVVRNDTENGFRCTMGFHVANGAGGDKQFVTAGHCAFEEPADWYHRGMAGDGFIGNVTKNLYDSDGIDIVRIQMPNAQVSRNVYASAWLVSDARPPTTGEPICASLGVSNVIDCGTVTIVFHHWGPTGLDCSCVQQGAQMSGINGIPGDSGSPIYRIFNQTDVALGSLSTADAFAEVQDALNFWGGDWIVHGT